MQIVKVTAAVAAVAAVDDSTEHFDWSRDSSRSRKVRMRLAMDCSRSMIAMRSKWNWVMLAEWLPPFWQLRRCY